MARRDEFREWREQIARRRLGIDFKPLTEAPFRASREPIFEDLRVARNTLGPGLIIRDEELLKDGDTSYALMISQSREVDVAHRERRLRLGFGDATLVHLGRTGTFGSARTLSYVPVVVPAAELGVRAAHPEDLAWRFIPRRSEALRLLGGYLRSLLRSRFRAEGDAEAVVRRHILDLAALAVTRHGAVGESGSSAVTAARRAAVLDHIAARFRDPELSVATVARSQNISPRYLQRLLEASGTPFTAHVNELRLRQAFALLSEPGGSGRRIADIALDVGFSDVSHFNRLFRSRFGDTPSGVRAGSAKPDLGARPEPA